MKVVVTVLLVMLVPAIAQAQKSDYQAGYIAGAQDAANAAVKFASAAAPTSQPAVAERRRWLGTNDDVNQYYNHDARFADAAHSFSGFFAWNGHTPSTGVTYTADAYPTTPATALSYMGGYPAGQYQVTWTGTATITFQWGQFVATDAHSGVLTLANPNQQIYIQVDGVNPADPLTSIHIWSPGYVPTGPMYRSEYLNLVKTFGAVRVMNSQYINDTKEVNWADRVTPTDWDQTSRGTALEFLVELAREANVDLWACVPAMANDDYVRQELQILHALPAVELELGNEDWNSGMPVPYKYLFGLANDPTICMQWDGNLVGGKIVPYLDATGKQTLGTDGRTRTARCVADRARQVSLIARQVFADKPAALHMVFAAQASSSDWAKSALDWTQARYGDTSKVFDELAVTGYFDSGGPLAANTLDALFPAMMHDIDVNLAGYFDAHNTIARQYGLQLVLYEAGQTLYPWQSPYNAATASTDVPYLAQFDPRMGLCYDELFAVAHQHGVKRLMNFSLIAADWNQYGYWPIYRSLTDSNPKVDACVREARRSNR
jgi:hypothetical protein